MMTKDNGYTVTDVPNVRKIEVEWKGYAEVRIYPTVGAVLSFDGEGLDDFIEALRHARTLALTMEACNDSDDD